MQRFEGLEGDAFEARLRRARGVLWDLDNTLYPIDAALESTFNSAIARAALEAGVKLAPDEAVRLADLSFREHGYSGRVFVREHGVDERWLHHRYHAHLDETAIARNAALIDLFGAVAASHAVITHGSRAWAQRVLDHLGLSGWFAEGSVLALEDYGFSRKSQSPAALSMAMERLGLEADALLFVEDTPRNLSIAYDMGIGTVLLHHGREAENRPLYVDAAYENAPAFMNGLLHAQRRPA